MNSGDGMRTNPPEITSVIQIKKLNLVETRLFLAIAYIECNKLKRLNKKHKPFPIVPCVLSYATDRRILIFSKFINFVVPNRNLIIISDALI